MYQTLAVFKNLILKKKSVVDQLPYKVAALQSQPSVLWKNGAYVTLCCRSAESSNIFKGKCLWWRLFSMKDASLEFIPAILLKTDSSTEVFEYGLFMVTLFKLSRNFLRDIFAKHFLTKSQASNLWVATLLETTCLAKYIELTFYSKGYLYCVKNYIYIRMPMPRFPSGREISRTNRQWQEVFHMNTNWYIASENLRSSQWRCSIENVFLKI